MSLIFTAPFVIVFPVELTFIDPNVQKHHEELGERRFDFCELEKITTKKY